MNEVMSGEAALARMRASMGPLHDRIETAVNLMTPELNADRYQRFLERSFGFIAACERRFDVRAAPPALHLEARMKTALLANDLAHFGHTPATLEQLEAPAQLPPVGSWPAALGYFYVIEGSTLGGQIIARHVRATIGMEAATSFLSDGRADVGTRWKQMLAVLTGAMSDERAEAEITAAAAQTFEILHRWHAA